MLNSGERTENEAITFYSKQSWDKITVMQLISKSQVYGLSSQVKSQVKANKSQVKSQVKTSKNTLNFES